MPGNYGEAARPEMTRRGYGEAARPEMTRRGYLSRSWEVSSVPDGVSSGGAGKGNRNPAIHADEKSDIPIVPRKSPNNGCSPAEAMEGRGIASGKAVDSPARRTQSRVSASMGFEGIRERVKQFIAMHSRHHLRQEPYAVILQVRICAGAAGNRRPYRAPQY